MTIAKIRARQRHLICSLGGQNGKWSFYIGIHSENLKRSRSIPNTMLLEFFVWRKWTSRLSNNAKEQDRLRFQKNFVRFLRWILYTLAREMKVSNIQRERVVNDLKFSYPPSRLRLLLEFSSKLEWETLELDIFYVQHLTLKIVNLYYKASAFIIGQI